MSKTTPADIAILVLFIVIATLTILFALIGVWTGDGRWGETAAILILPALFTGTLYVCRLIAKYAR